MLARVPQFNVDQAKVQTVSVGELSLGPISVGTLTLRDVDLALDANGATLQDVHATLTLKFTVEWAIHIGLPWPLHDINVGDTVDLGSFSYGLALGDVTIPVLQGLKFNIPTLEAQNLSVQAAPLAVALNNVTADKLAVADLAVPSAGFSIAGLSVASASIAGVGVPAAGAAQATLEGLHADPLRIPALTLDGLALPAVNIPTISSTVPLDITLDLQGPSPGFDAGVVKFILHVIPSVETKVAQMVVTGARASASAQEIVLHDVVLPFDAHGVTLSQIGVTNVQVPAINVA